MNEWKEYRLDEAPLKIIDGDRGKNYPKQEDFLSSGYCLFLSTKNVRQTGFDFSECNFISKEKDTLLRKGKLILNDVVLTTRGTIGNLGFYKEDKNYKNIRINSGMVIIRPDILKLNPQFCFYLFRGLQESIKEYTSGSAQPQLPIRDLSQIKVKIPSLVTQFSIGNILSSLDDKIELNNQINQNLEALAQALFKCWFVDFEFPNENGQPYKSSGGEIVQTELGDIPKGWEVAELCELTDRITDGAHQSPKSKDSGFPMASVKDMTSWDINFGDCRKISEEDYLKLVQQGCKPVKGDVLIAKDGSFLKHAFVQEETQEVVILSSIAILRANYKINPHFLNLYLKQKPTRERLNSIVSGAVIQRIVLKDFRKFKMPVFPKQLQERLAPTIESLIATIWSYNKENKSLALLRDLLLPKLIAGELPVKQAEKILMEA